MTFVRRYDYSLLKKLLLVLGCWPTPNSKFRLFQITFFYTIYIGYLLLEITWFYTFECDIVCVANILSIFIQNLMIILKYFFHHRHMTAVYTLYTAIEFDWKFLENDKPSIEILRKYAELVHIILISLMMSLCFGNIVTVFIHQTLPVLQIPEENYTRFWQRPFALKALGKAISYPTFYLISLNILLNNIILITSEITFMAFSEHACGLFKITSYHLRYAANEYIKESSGCEKNSDIYTKIIFAVRIHVKAIKHVQVIWNMFEMHYTIAIFLGIIGGTMVFVSFYQSVQMNDEGRILMIILALVLSSICYATFAMYFGQRLIDHSLGVFYDAWNSHWYRIPVKAQKLYLMVLTRSLRGCSFSKDNLFVSSLQGLTAVTRFTSVTV